MQNSKENSNRAFNQMGMFVSICVFLVLLIKSAIFGFSWASIVWLLIVLVYWCLCAFFTYKKPDEKCLKWSTLGFLTASLVVFVGLTMFDKNARPKMHAFEGVGVDSVEEDTEFVVDETPDISVYTPDTTVVDTIRVDTLTASPAAEEPDMVDTDDVEEE